MKCVPKFDYACKVRSDREKHDKKPERVSAKDVIPKVKEEFVRSVRSYNVYLSSETQGLTADTIKGLWAFDLSTWLIDSPELGSYCL